MTTTPSGRAGISAIVAALAFGALSLASPATPASLSALCASGQGPRTPIPVPSALEAEVARAFGVSVDAVGHGGFVRCAGNKLVACLVGANLNCGKANVRSRLAGASAYCRANPGSDMIPMAATGHDTIYAWRCAGKRAVAGKALVAVDPGGYDAANWKELRR